MQVYVQDGSLFAEVPSLLTTPTDQMKLQKKLLTLLVEELENWTSTTGEVYVDGETKFVRKITCPDIREALVILNKLVEDEHTTLRIKYPDKRSRGAPEASLTTIAQDSRDDIATYLDTHDQVAFGTRKRNSKTKFNAPGTVTDAVLHLNHPAGARWFRRIFENDDKYAKAQRAGKRFEATHAAQVPEEATKKGLIRFLNECPNLKQISFRGCADVDDEVVCHVIKGFPKLRTLVLSNCKRVYDLSKLQERVYDLSKLRDLVQYGLQELRELHLSGCYRLIDDGFYRLTHSTQLIYVYLNGCNRLTDRAVQSLAHCPQLSILKLGGCTQITDAGVCPLVAGVVRIPVNNRRLSGSIYTVTPLDIAESCWGNKFEYPGCKQLKHLDLSDSEHISDTTLNVLHHCPQLNTLLLGKCAGVSDAGIIALTQGCTQLSTFTLTECAQLTDAGYSALGTVPLQVLKLYECTQLTDVSRLVQPQLETLILARCTRLIDVSAIARATRLTWLSLSGSPLVMNEGVGAIGEACPRLRHLNLASCSRVSWGIQTVAQGCPDLDFLHAANSAVGDAEVHALAQRRLTNLNLDGCDIHDAAAVSIAQMPLRRLGLNGTWITDAGVRTVVQSCHDLESLKLSMNEVGDDGWAAIGQHCPNLRSLGLIDTNVTDAGLVAFASFASFASEVRPEFKSLYISECANITQAAVVQARRMQPRWNINFN
jgi:hypothetical protein